MKIGILGGTFDPIHIGHLVIAEEARTALGLSEVLFAPAGQPWLKLDRDVSPAVHRVEMVRRAIADNHHFKLCTLEVERAGPSYTVDTLTALREQMGSQAEFFFMLGRDTLADLPLWKEPERVAQLCRLVVAPRPVLSGSGGPAPRDLDHLETTLPGVLEEVIQLDMPVIGISSSDIRRRVAHGLSFRYLVPAEVARYITEQGLYMPSAG